jgi:two-component system, cell cycle sensor histidine kinase and response regulator CckA
MWHDEKTGETAMCVQIGSLGQEEFGEKTSAEAIGWRPQTNAEPPKGTETILLVEDEAFVRQVTAEVLCAAGYGVLIAQNAEDALKLYHRHAGAVDLLLTDLILPGQSGSELAARLKSLDRGLKILFVTGYVERLKTMEGQDCLPKPFSTPVLLEKVRQVLDRRAFAAAV